MAELKTKATTASVVDFLNGIEDDTRREDCKALVSMMTRATKAKPRMWGTAIIGFGDHEYFGASGKPTKWFEVGFSPRKAALSLYLMGGKDAKLVAKLGATKLSSTGMEAGCLYIKRLDDVHKPTLQKLIETSVKRVRAKSPK
ncbi:MAG TPA: DUF1801 domain-containing protein [Vicinamibacterales bacterium]|nr:DUF1801 domain-containing protein [Vicinamibacterales bacterium]